MGYKKIIADQVEKMMKYHGIDKEEAMKRVKMEPTKLPYIPNSLGQDAIDMARPPSNPIHGLDYTVKR
jgi:hypothetical protein